MQLPEELEKYLKSQRKVTIHIESDYYAHIVEESHV